MIAKEPLRFIPYLKTVIWGGGRICRFKDMESAASNVGESWEISGLPGFESVVAEGRYEGRTLTRLISEYGASLLGERVLERYGGQFPLLIKLIDANDDLSVQVHPDDRLATMRHGCRGKNEMWYVVEARSEAKIFAGLKSRISAEEYEMRVKAHRFMDSLKEYDSRPGDVFFIPSGTVHAIGAGNFLVEIQDSSDITYRIYDYGRRDLNGNPRELHTELSKEAIDFDVRPSYKCPPINDEEKFAQLVKTDNFTTWRLSLDGGIDLEFDNDSYTAMVCVEGNAIISYSAGNMEIKYGQTVLFPSVLNQFHLEGRGVFLLSRS